MRDLMFLGAVGCVCIAAIGVAAILKGFDTGLITSLSASIGSIITFIVTHTYYKRRK